MLGAKIAGVAGSIHLAPREGRQPRRMAEEQEGRIDGQVALIWAVHILVLEKLEDLPGRVGHIGRILMLQIPRLSPP